MIEKDVYYHPETNILGIRIVFYTEVTKEEYIHYEEDGFVYHLTFSRLNRVEDSGWVYIGEFEERAWGWPSERRMYDDVMEDE